MKNKFSDWITNKYFFWCLIIIFAILKYLLINNLPLYALVDAYYDDELMMKLTNSIISGNWLGEYNKNTLVKGCMYPIFVACARWIGLSYSSAIILLYIISCILFCAAIKKFIRNDGFIIILYIFLLFNPASMDLDSYQRIYRCSVTPSQVLLVFAAFFSVYHGICIKKQLTIKEILWTILAGISLSFFFHTREDSIWILPFIFVITLVGISLVLLNARTIKPQNIVLNIIILLIPILLLINGNFIISSLNYKYYGIRATTELTDTAFPDCIKAIYSVKSEDDIKHVTTSRAKVNKLYAISPTLNSIKNELETSLDNWNLSDRNPEDGEVDDGWFLWALRDAVESAGYYSSPQVANNFFADVANEIADAKKEGLVESQPIMPSALMSPWRRSHKPDFIQAIKDSIDLIFNFKGTEASLIVHNKYYFEQKPYEYYEFTDATGNYFLEEETLLNISGWAFFKNSSDDVSVELFSGNGEQKMTLTLQDSIDVYNYFQDEGYAVSKNLLKCRFECNILCSPEDKFYIRILAPDNSESFIFENGTVQAASSIYCYIDDFSKKNRGNTTIVCENAVNHVNAISNIYRHWNGLLGIISVIAYLIILLYNFWAIYKRCYVIEYWNELMLSTALIASLATLIIGVSYTDAYSYGSIGSFYYSGAYSMVIPFELISIYYAAKRMTHAIKMHRNIT